MVSAKGKRAAGKAWRSRRSKYGSDGLSTAGEKKIVAATRRRRK